MKSIYQLLICFFLFTVQLETLKATIPLFTLSSTEVCSDEEVTVSPEFSGFDTYLWDFGNGNTSTAQNPPAFSYNPGGIYEVTLQVSDVAGIHILNSVTIDSIPDTWQDLFDPAPDLYIIIRDAAGNIVCSTPPGNFNYSIPHTFELESIIVQQNYTITVMEYDLLGVNDFLGTITFNGSDDDGSYEDTATGMRLTIDTEIVNELIYSESITVESSLEANIEVLQFADDNGENATITANINGIITNPEYLWSNGATMPTLSNIPAGDYSVTITATGFCNTIRTISFDDFFEMIASDPDCENMAVYGISEVDINQPYKMIRTQDGHFILAGSWNGEAFLQKIDIAGNVLDQISFGDEIGGTSRFSDLIEQPDGTVIAAGDCEFCVEGDSLKKVFVLKTTADLVFDALIGVKKYGGPECCPYWESQVNPSIVIKEEGIFLTGKLIRNAGLNYNDFSLLRLNASLDTLWAKAYNSCGNCGFENPAGLAATSTGIAVIVKNVFTDSISVFNINVTGDVLWKTRLNWLSVLGLAVGNDGLIAVTGYVSGNGKDAVVQLLDESTGAIFGDPLILGDQLLDIGRAVKALPGGGFLLAMTSSQPNAFGSYITSRVYKLTSTPLTVVDSFCMIPSPNDYTNMVVASVISLDDNGNTFAASGARGLNVRSFFYSKLNADDTTTIEVILCEGESYQLPDSLIVEESGIYTTTFQNVMGCDSTVITQVSVNPASFDYATGYICEGEIFILPDGSEAQESGIYQTIFSNIMGCDSTVVTNLEISVPTTENFILNICKGETAILPDGTITDEEGTYLFNFLNTYGCDSTIIADVIEYGEFFISDTIITPDTGLSDGAISLEVSGGNAPYQYLWEDGSITSGLTGLIEGVYQVTITDECETIMVLILVVPLIVATSETIEEVLFKVYPNPFHDHFIIETEENLLSEGLEMQVFNSQGQLVKSQYLHSDQENVFTDYLPSGFYVVRLTDAGKLLARSTLVKD